MPHRIDPSTLPSPLGPAHGPAATAAGAGASAPVAGSTSAGASPGQGPGAPASWLLAGGVLVAALLAAALGFGVAWWLQPLQVRTAGLAAAVAAAVAVVLVAAPLVGMLWRQMRRIPVPAEAAPAPAPVEAPSRPPAPSGDTPAASSTAMPVESGRGATAAVFGQPLQGLALSREMFMDMVAREWSRARRYGTGAALLLIEIDRYPRLVEALGHAAGEKVLAEVLAATAPTLRGADALARYEAGRFTVFLAHADATGALDVAERVRERAEQMEVAVPPRRVRFTVSVGVAHLRPAHLYLQALIDDVVDALGAARQAGGNCVRAAPVDSGQRPAPGAARDGSRADKK